METTYVEEIHPESQDDSCSRLLTDGHFKADNSYQPTGCMLHKYTASDADRCLKQHENLDGSRPLVVFIGDSRIRQQFIAIRNLLEEKKYVYNPIHRDLFYNTSKDGHSMEFRWRPTTDIVTFLQHWNSTYKHGAPSVAILGMGLHFIDPNQPGEQQKENFTLYKNTLKAVIKLMSNIRDTKFVWMMQDPAQSADRKDGLSDCNEVADALMQNEDVSIWRSSKHVALRYLEESVTGDGHHLGKHALTWDSQVLVNLLCNNISRPVDGTCCKEWPKFHILQSFKILLFFLSLLLCTAVKLISWDGHTTANMEVTDKKGSLTQVPGHMHGTERCGDDTGHMANGKIKLTDPPSIDPENQMREGRTAKIKAIMITCFTVFKFTAILAYFHVCGRTSMFGAENKVYQGKEFSAALGMLLFLGLITIRKSHSNEILNRQQTDEWKGWMQLVILVYHYTGASKDLQIYMYIRVLVSSYLFMTGYGHVMHALKHTKSSPKQVMWRSLEVLFRMNALTVSLGLVMGKTYQFYYFVPLVSFWFVCIMLIAWTAIYVTSYVKKASCTDSTLAECRTIIGLTVTCFTLTTALYNNQDIFELFFSWPVIKPLFAREDGTTHEWYFRWSIDRYSSFYGIVVGVGLVVVKHYTWTKSLNKCCHYTIMFFLALTSVCGVLTYLAAGEVCSTKPECNFIHPMVCVIPIFSYILLRNISEVIRSYHSLFFTWAGKISLELFISQYHIWLAADTAGVLVIIPGYSLTNIFVTTLIFVCISHEISRITTVLSQRIFH